MKKAFGIFILFIALASCQLAPCLTKDSFVSSTKTNYEKFKKNQDDFSDSQWENMDSQYEKFLDDCYPKFKKDMTSDEVKTFWINTSQYFIKRSYKGPEMTEKLQELYGKQFETYLEEMGSNFSEKFKNLIDINVDDAVDKIFDLLGKWGKEEK